MARTATTKPRARRVTKPQESPHEKAAEAILLDPKRQLHPWGVATDVILALRVKHALPERDEPYGEDVLRAAQAAVIEDVLRLSQTHDQWVIVRVALERLVKDILRGHGQQVDKKVRDDAKAERLRNPLTLTPEHSAGRRKRGPQTPRSSLHRDALLRRAAKELSPELRKSIRAWLSTSMNVNGVGYPMRQVTVAMLVKDCQSRYNQLAGDATQYRYRLQLLDTLREHGVERVGQLPEHALAQAMELQSRIEVEGPKPTLPPPPEMRKPA